MHKFNRLTAIAQMRIRLEREGFPRFQMLFLVILTGGTGFLASFIMLRAGLTEMWLRYLLAFFVAYLVFLLLLWLWLRTKADDYADAADIVGNVGPLGPDLRGPDFHGRDGDFGGGGASASFDDLESTPYPSDSGDSPIGDAVEAVTQGDELAIPLIVIILIAGLVLSSLWVVYIAPALFAELLIDGALTTVLYRRLRKIDQRHWLESAMRRTAWPFVLTAGILVSAGLSMESYAPGAHSIGDVIQYAQMERGN